MVDAGRRRAATQGSKASSSASTKRSAGCGRRPNALAQITLSVSPTRTYVLSEAATTFFDCFLTTFKNCPAKNAAESCLLGALGKRPALNARKKSG